MRISCEVLVGKLYFRRGIANASDKIKKFEEAIDDLENAEVLNPSSAPHCERVIKETTSRKLLAAKQETKRLRRAFSS